MINLMVFLNPAKKFVGDYETLVKLQIDNSIKLGWEEEDILLATNFDYEYRGVKATVVDDSCYYATRPRGTKLMVICYLLEKGMIKDLCWIHDPDALQLQPFKEGELDLEGKDAGFVFSPNGDYQFSWNSGSFFFKPEFKDIFDEMKRICFAYRCHDEQALSIALERNVNNVGNRYKRLDPTYNLCHLRGTKDMTDVAEKPIRVLHDELRELVKHI